MTKESFKQWLDGQEQYAVPTRDFEHAQNNHNVDVDLPVGITIMRNEKGETSIPCRDIRHGEWRTDTDSPRLSSSVKQRKTDDEEWSDTE